MLQAQSSNQEEKNKKEKERKQAHRSLFIDRRRSKLRERERKKISARYTPLYAPVLSIDVGIRCCQCCRLCWRAVSEQMKVLVTYMDLLNINTTAIFLIITCHSIGIPITTISSLSSYNRGTHVCMSL